MYKLFKISLYILLLFKVSTLSAQSFPLYTQYLLNEFTVNPSMAGIDGMTSINISGRQQWAFSPQGSFPYTPQTYSASFSTRILKSPGATRSSRGRNKLNRSASGKVAFGTSVFSDYNGPVSKSGMQLVYAYHIPLHNAQLSFGIAGLAYQLKIDGSELIFDPNNRGDVLDPNISSIIDRPQYIFDAGVGINFSTSKFHIGASSYQLFEASLKVSDTQGLKLTQTRYYYVTSTYKYRLNNWMEAEPSVVLRTNESFNIVADMCARVVYKKSYWGGLGFRTTGDFLLFAGVKMGKYYLGYSLDYGFSSTRFSVFGSHELLVAIKFGDSTRRYRWWERY